jgi:hypothetical protein
LELDTTVYVKARILSKRFLRKKKKKKKKKNSGSRGSGVNGVSFRARPHHNVHCTLGVDTRTTNPRWRVDSIEGGEVGRGGKSGRGR